MNQESKSRLRQLHALYLGSRVHRIPRTPEMAADQGQTVRERRRALVVPGGNRHRALPVAAQLQGQHGDERTPGQQDGGGRAIAWSDHWRWVARPSWARLSSNVTASDPRMTTHARLCAGVACRSVQKTASMRSWPSGSATNPERRSPGDNPGGYHRAVREKPHSF